MRKPHKQTEIHSTLHRFLNEEGFSNVMICDILQISTTNSVTLKKYMEDPTQLKFIIFIIFVNTLMYHLTLLFL